MLSAFFSIQVESGSEKKLDAYPDIINWIDKIGKAKFVVQWNNNTEKSAKPQVAKLDKELYQSLFTARIKVRPYMQEDLTLYPIRSYPVKYIQDFIHNSYAQVGNTASNLLPGEKFFTDDWQNLVAISEYKVNESPKSGREKVTEGSFVIPDTSVRERMKMQLRAAKAIPFASSATPMMDFAQLRNFHDATTKSSGKPPVIAPPDFEYHDILSVLTSYPQLQRKFGMVIDLELDATSVPANGTVRIIPQDIDFTEAAKISCPAIATIKTATGFYAQADASSMIDRGLLKLKSGDFTVVQVDADGAALKLCNMIDNLQQKKAKHLFYLASAGMTPQKQLLYENDKAADEGLPSLRSAGIGVAKNGLAAVLAKKFQRSNTLRPSLVTSAPSTAAFKGANATFVLPAGALTADDVVQGYRMDVAYAEKPDDWKSLHWRQDEYIFKPDSGGDKQVQGIEMDEGFIQLAMAQDTAAPDKPMSVGEVLARWEGWSLSVVKPGKALNNPEPGGTELQNDSKEKERYILPKYLDFRLQANSHLPKNGTLPRLRFGQQYRIKIRTVDLAGNSLPHLQKPENDAIAVMDNIRYRRYEPVSPPALVLGNAVRDGESMEHMVIRSNYNVSATDYENNNVGQVNGSSKKYPDRATRFIKAPRTSQQMAEVHGMFDAAFANPEKAKELYDFIVSRDKETVNPSDYSTLTNAVFSGEAKDLKLEYLADPMAAGVVFCIERFSDELTNWPKTQPRFFSFYLDTGEVHGVGLNAEIAGKWMNPNTLAIRLLEGNTLAAEWRNNERTLYVQLPKGRKITLNYASFWRPDDVKDKSALFDVLFSGPSANAKARDHASNGQHWMFSPWRQLTLTHAVQQPLNEPVLKTVDAVRAYNDTTAALNTLVRVSGISTDKVNIEAAWKEFTDDLAEIGPDVKPASAHVDVLQVQYDDATLVSGSPLVNGQPYTPAANESIHKYAPLVQRFGDTKHRNVEYRPVATSRYREYFTVLRQNAEQAKKPFDLTRKGDGFKLNVLSTARPQAPQVEYVLPSFNWLKNVSPKVETHLRTGNVRVYMKRPWFTSGEGEKIAVVLSPNKFSEEYAKHVTLWGRDPIYASAQLNGANFPNADQTTFPFAVDYEKSLSIVEADGLPVAAASYNVLYDPERQLYYADIPINISDAYFPFVKLALARYQKDSLRINNTDCCLSPVVHTDWIQVVPHRTTAVTFGDPLNKQNIGVSVKGSSRFGYTMPTAMALPKGGENAWTRIRIVVEAATIPKKDEAFVRLAGDRRVNPIIWSKDFDITTDFIKNGIMEFSTPVNLRDEYKNKPYRVVIEEYDLHMKDPLRVENTNFAPGSEPLWSDRVQERLVFMDVFEVNGTV